jgi:NAD(P)-dependent dehydrogenase (short-subunit alcohol dehydrogenase family)
MASVEQQFHGKRALVTGATRGMGRAIAEALIREGAEVYGLASSQTNLDALVKELPGLHPICADLADWSATRTAIEAIEPVHFLVNNAGIANPVSFLEVDKDVVDREFEVNVKAAINVSQVVARKMVDKGIKGSIVNISSICAERPVSMETVYSATKAALDAMTKGMALELGPYGIRVNSVRPTAVPTDMFLQQEVGKQVIKFYTDRTPLGRPATTVDVANAALFLLSDKACMVTGSLLAVDGGLLAPLM